ncbi:Sal-like protein 1, partial [Zootermopsis nevadensis]
MDITEAFRGEDISKTDFFDFVVTPDVGEHQQTLHFNRTLKSMGIFIESNNSNNNNDPGTTTYQDVKESNNNHLMMTTTAPSGLPPTDHSMGNFGDHSFWTSSSCDKETVRLETAILEDLNKFCWSQDSTESASPNSNGGSCHKVSISNSTHNNTDGAIYTLTVLNGGDHTLDLDSILSIIPNQPSATPTPTSSSTSTGHQFHQNGYRQNHSLSSNHLHQTNDSAVTLSPHHTISQDGLVKSEQQYTYEDSGASFNNNNNDWKLANNNSNSTADSLLRNALQGKMFIASDITDDCSGGDQKPSPLMTVTMEGNAVVMFDGGGGSRGLGLTDSDNPSSAHSMDDILLSQLDAASYPEDYEKLKRIANEVAESVNQYCNLDQNSIASPTQHAPSGIYISTQLSSADNLVPNSILSSTHHHHHHHHHANLSTILTTSQSTTKTSVGKKYTKKQSGSGGGGSTKAAHSSHQLQSNGVRKERSLHYCNICSKGFKDKYSVNVHIRTHTGEKPFACSLCGKSFRQKAHLAKHYQTHMAQK